MELESKQMEEDDRDIRLVEMEAAKIPSLTPARIKVPNLAKPTKAKALRVLKVEKDGALDAVVPAGGWKQVQFTVGWSRRDSDEQR